MTVGTTTIATIIQMLLPKDVQNFWSCISAAQFSSPIQIGGRMPRHSVNVR